MKYQFECDEIKHCANCPCADHENNECKLWRCRPIRADSDWYDKPSWCPLTEVKDKYEKGDFVDGIYTPQERRISMLDSGIIQSEKEKIEELKKCPFCGGEARVTDGGFDGRHFFVGCKTEECIAYTGITKITRQEAIATWNWRVENGLGEEKN